MYKISRFSSIVFLAVALFLSTFSYSRNWQAPEDAKSKNSYIKFDASTASQGEALYNANCASCHGNPGKNNSLKSLNPIPPDLSMTPSQKLNDGELLYIISNGAGIMPSFKNILSEEKAWYVISYLRGFNKDYVQQLSKFDPAKSKLVKLTTVFDAVKNSIEISAVANEKTGTIAIAGAEVSLFVKRYFGNIQIDKTVKTDATGKVTILFPKDMPGNKTGELDVIVKMFDNNYGEVQSASKFQIGIPTDKPALNENRAIWNVVSKAPIWIIALYSLGILSFLLLLAFLLNNLRNIFKS